MERPDTAPKATSVLFLRRETPDTVLLRIAAPGLSFVPGQFVMIGMSLPGVPREVKRSYSVASAPNDEWVELLIKKQEKGLVSSFVQDMKTGDALNLYGPFGRHFVFDVKRYEAMHELAPASSEQRSHTPHIVFIAGGSGIAPFRSILEMLVARKYTGAITLIYSVRNAQDIIAHGDLVRLTSALPGARLVITLTRPTQDEMSSWKGLFGRITKKTIVDVLGSDLTQYEFWICGPSLLVLDAKRVLTELGVLPAVIKTENYGAIEG